MQIRLGEDGEHADLSLDSTLESREEFGTATTQALMEARSMNRMPRSPDATSMVSIFFFHMDKQINSKRATRLGS